MQKRVGFLLNRRSGSEHAERLERELDKLSKRSIVVTGIESFSSGNVASQLRAMGNPEIVFVGGGDGTISTVLAELLGTHVTVGILPLGTGNDLARDLGLYAPFVRRPLFEYLESCLAGMTVPLSLWQLLSGETLQSPISFCNYVSFGFDASIVRRFSQGRDNRRSGRHLNRMRYIVAGLQSFADGLVKGVVVKGKGSQEVTVEPCRSVLVTNVRSYMGMARLAMVEGPLDNLIEVVGFSSWLSYPAALLPYHTRYSPKLLIRSEELVVEGVVGMSLQVDGEAREPLSANECRIRRSGSVPILVP